MQAHPEKLPVTPGAAGQASPVPDVPAANAAPSEARGLSEAVSTSAVGAPKTAAVYRYYKLDSDELITEGPHRGKHCKTYICQIETAPGVMCNCIKTIRHVGKSHASTNLITHITDKASKGCAAHQEASLVVKAGSKNQVEVNGTFQTIHSFSEAFPHHVDYVWLHSDGLPGSLSRRPTFRKYVRGYQPCAAFPHHSTVHRLVECIEELQSEEQQSRIEKMKRAFNGEMCIGLQLDM